jgi:hypothetical protein
VEFFFDVHAAVDHTNNGDLIELNRVEDQMESYHKTTEPGSKTRTFPANKWKSSQVREIRIDPLNEVVRRIRTSFFEIPIDSKQVQLCFVGKEDDHSRDYLGFIVRA